MTTVVIAPDSFKGSARATAVAEALARGWRERRPDDEVLTVPMADGGEGTLEAFEQSVRGATRHVRTVRGPADDPVTTFWLELPATKSRGTMGVIELASASGIELMPTLAPLTSHTFGFGELIRDAISAGMDSLLLAIGGSASTDGGTGALSALGARFMDSHGEPVPLGGGHLEAVRSVDLSSIVSVPPGGASVLTDVRSPLLGDHGAAAIFGPQKGASAPDVARLDAGLASIARLLGADPNAPGAGAAGGTGYGLLAWGARLTSGARAVAAAVGLERLVAGADLVITGEGSYDAQSAQGKAPSVVLDIARAHATRSAVVAGRVGVAERPGLTTVSLTQLAGSTEGAIGDPLRWLAEAGRILADREGAC